MNTSAAMKSRVARGLSCLLVFIPLVVSACLDTPISTYKAGTPDETEIVSLLIQYQAARNTHDLDLLLSLLHDGGEFALQCGRMVTKAVLQDELPAFWNDILTDNAAVFPIVHECINGEYYKTGTLNNPEITVNNDTANATVLFTKGVCRVPLYVSMRREDNRWWITRTQWGDG